MQFRTLVGEMAAAFRLRIRGVIVDTVPGCQASRAIEAKLQYGR